METLGIQDMLQNNNKNNKLYNVEKRKRNLDISDASWYSFKQKMKYKLEWSGKNLLECDRYDATSKTCYCGYLNKELTDEIKWPCPKCGRVNLRDKLGADNTKKFALKNFFDKQISVK